MSDERPNSLAAQAASWVPPWERAAREPDRAYRAAAEAEPDDAPEPAVVGQPDEGDKVDEAGLSDDDDFDEAFERPNPPAYGASLSAADPSEDVPAELPPLPGESGGAATVDAPTELGEDDEAGPTEVGGFPDLPVPAPIEEAIEEADADEPGSPVDAPLPPDGDDAGDVFDAAADDDVDDDAEVDLPFEEEIPPAAAPPADAPPADAPPADAPPAGAPPALAGPGATASIPTQGRNGRAPVAAEEPPALADDAELRAALEAILLVVDEPVAEMQLAQILEQPTERVAAMLDDISARYTAAGHGFDLRRAAGGWRLYTRPEYAAYVERFVLDGQSVRLTQAALETLAVVAYKQPVTRSRISAIRGVNCDGVMRTLVTRGLIEECGTEGETGAYLYRTTGLFLEKLGLNSVDQLPPLAPFLPDDVEEVLDASG